MMSNVIYSPPPIELDTLTPALQARFHCLAQLATLAPDYAENGRNSIKITFQGVGDCSELHDVASEIGQHYIGASPSIGSVAIFSTVSNSENFNTIEAKNKVASYWHQDFIEVNGAYSRAQDSTRVIAHSLVGTEYMSGSIELGEEPRTIWNSPPKCEIPKLGQVVLGADGVLLHAKPDSIQGTVTTTSTDKVYILPPTTVHRSHGSLPTGRSFLQIDFKNIRKW